MSEQAQFKEDLLAAVPALRAFALSLSGKSDQADDLVQETLMRALTYREQFTPGTSLQAWLFTILRNQFYSDHRKRRQREVEDPDDALAARLAVGPDQDGHLELQDFRAAFARLAPPLREALLLVGAEGLSYEEAAEICGVALGTVKSRVNRARTRLAELLGVGDGSEIGTDSLTRASLRSVA